MPTYVMLGRFTEKGLDNIKDGALIKRSYEACTKAGGQLKAFYMTVGQYDCIAIWEFPSDEALAKALLGVGSIGAIRTETMGAMSWDQAKEAISKT
jgi:uncharacterized protein with GYD domain